MMAFKEATIQVESTIQSLYDNGWDVLVMMSTNPRCRSYHRNHCDHYAKNAPREDGWRCVVCTAMLKGAYDGVDEPCDTRSSAAGVDTTEMLK